MSIESSGATTIRTSFPGLAWVPTFGVVAVPAIVIPAILAARVAFHVRHPDASPDIYLTISRAISDPVIGEPFAVWVTIAAGLLWPTYLYLLWMFRAQYPTAPVPTGLRAVVARLSLVLGGIAATGSCTGMVVLSHWRLGDDEGLHMVGSYLFFVSQAAALVLVAVHHHAIATARRAAPVTRFFAERWRIRIGYAIGAAAVLYGVLFRVKELDLGAATPWIVSVYVETETLLIIAFLLYLFAFCVDVFGFASRRR